MMHDWQRAGWPVVRIRDIGRLHGGGTPSRKRPEYFQGEIPWITGQDIPDNRVATIEQARDYVTEEAVAESATRVVPAGAVLITTRVSVGKTAVAGRPICFSQDVTALLIHSEAIALPAFVAHYLRSRQPALLQKNQGSTIAGITRDSLALEQIPLPPLSEQHRIVDILQEAEEIRRLRAQAEAKTAELIPALFHQMFGDPVANPKKWRKVPLGELINGTPKNGLYKPADLYGEGTPIIRIGDFTGGILRDAKGLQRVRIADEEAAQFGVASGQIVINRVNSIEHLGKSLLLAGLTEPTVYESNMMRLDPKLDEVLPDYLIACLQHGSILSKLRAKAKKAINQASINQTDVVTLEIPVPPLEAQQKFAAQVRAVDELLSDEATTLRKGQLLAKALSAHAFTGQLTETWRAAHVDEYSQPRLIAEIKRMMERGDRIVHFVGLDFSLSPAKADLVTTIGLTREQEILRAYIMGIAQDGELPRYFTAEHLAEQMKGPLHRHPQAIESHLTVFAARGIVIPVSRARDAVPGKPFAASYRLPMNQEGAASEQRDDVKAERMKHQRTRAAGKR